MLVDGRTMERLTLLEASLAAFVFTTTAVAQEEGKLLVGQLYDYIFHKQKPRTYGG